MTELKQDLGTYEDFSTLPAYQSLKLGGVTLIESCTHCHVVRHMMQLSQNLLLIQLAGIMELTEKDKAVVTLRRGQAMLATAGTTFFFHKVPDPTEGMRVLLINLSADHLRSFAGKHPNLLQVENAKFDGSIWPADERLTGMVLSVLPFLADPPARLAGWLANKVEEIFHLLVMAGKAESLAFILARETKRTTIPIAEVMERSYLSNFSVPELAKLSGRSTSVFKREFETLYHMPPMTWVRQRRLQHARMLITQYKQRVSEACYATGFANLSHFSRLYKAEFGIPPSEEYKHHDGTMA